MRGLNAEAKYALRNAGVTQAAWARQWWQEPDLNRWSGDECGCPDDRCIGYHHESSEECDCLLALLKDYTSGLAAVK